MKVRVRRLPHGEGLPLPAYETQGSAGMDLVAALPVNECIIVYPGDRALIPTGLSVAVPPRHEMQIRPRSGLALREGVTVHLGTIDHDYRGEVKVILINAGSGVFTVRRGMRISQAVFAPVVRAEWEEVSGLDETERGSGGFGSTGTT